MSSKKDQTPIDVSWDDQRNICTFSRLHRRMTELNDEISKRKTDIDKIVDAADEIIIADDVKHVFGESFITMGCDEASDLLEQRKELLNKELAEFQAESDEIEKNMENLKGQLYAKFGSHIYLENE
eukprot:Tbor_TRINITY_DN5317_c3_g1::TRINITY_DN5317_c3_g1_i16::g.4580::m.4580/K09550/PFDN4; prefoldin subunit 4